MLTLWAMRFGAALLPLAPRTVASVLAELVGALGYVFGRRARLGVGRNLVVVLGRGDPDLIARRARQAFRTQAMNYVDLLRVPRMELGEIAASVDVQGWERFEEARARGRGVVVAAVHLGNIDLVAQVACARRVPVTIPVEAIKPRELYDFVTALRAAHGLRLVPVGVGTLGVLVAALRRGDVVAMAIDRDVAVGDHRGTFFGRSARVSAAAVVLARRAGAALVAARVERVIAGEAVEPAVAARDGGGVAADRGTEGRGDGGPWSWRWWRRGRVRLLSALGVTGSGRWVAKGDELAGPERAVAGGASDAVRFVVELSGPLEPSMTALTGWLEEAIRRTPGQWVMFQPLFDD